MKNAIDKMSLPHRTFALEYVRTRNASVAYSIAYPDAERSTCGTRSVELMKDPKIQSLIKDYQDILAETHAVDAHRLIEELKKIAFSDVLDVVDLKEEVITEAIPAESEGGEPAAPRVIGRYTDIRLRHAGEIPDDARGAVQEITRGKDGAFKVKMHSKIDAIKTLGSHLGLFEQKVNVDVHVTHDLTEAARETLERIKQIRGGTVEIVKDVA